MVSKKRLMLNISTLHLVFYASVVAKIIGSSAIENIIKDTVSSSIYSDEMDQTRDNENKWHSLFIAAAIVGCCESERARANLHTLDSNSVYFQVCTFNLSSESE